MENVLIGRRLAVLPGDRRKKILSVASNASDGWRTTFTPFSSKQIIKNLSMKISYHLVSGNHSVRSRLGLS